MSLTIRHLLTIRQSIEDSKAAVLVTVTFVKGSAPRGPGTAMIVFEDSLVSTIGGGRLEFEAIDKARKIMEHRTDESLRERYPLGDRLGQCCGGSVELLFEPVKQEWATWISEALEIIQTGIQRRTPANTRTTTQNGGQNTPEFVRTSDDGYRHIIQAPAAHLVLCGAGHVGRALVQVLANAPISVHWVDERSKEFPENVPLNVMCEVSDTPEFLVENAPVNSAVLITTHRHDLDFSLAETALLRTDLAYCGMIGSASKRNRFERLWRQRGRNEATLQNLVCPIGRAGPSGKEPEMVAIAVAAEILSALQN